MRLITTIVLIVFGFTVSATKNAAIWSKYTITFNSSKTYNNPVYDVKAFNVTFTAPSGIKKTVNGFWNGSTSGEVRFLPGETGAWSWIPFCSDKENKGLDGQTVNASHQSRPAGGRRAPGAVACRTCNRLPRSA